MTRRFSAAVLVGYATLSFLYFGVRIAAHPGRTLIGFGRDPQIFVWALGWWPHALTAGVNPFLTRAVFAPDGLDLAWAASIPALAFALWPLTEIGRAHV